MKELSKALFQLFFLASKRPLKMTSSLLISSEYYGDCSCVSYIHMQQMTLSLLLWTTVATQYYVIQSWNFKIVSARDRKQIILIKVSLEQAFIFVNQAQDFHSHNGCGNSKLPFCSKPPTPFFMTSSAPRNLSHQGHATATITSWQLSSAQVLCNILQSNQFSPFYLLFRKWL